MTTLVRMTTAMEAYLRHLVHRAFEDTLYGFDKAMVQAMTQPMPTLTKTTTFRITTPGDGAREFTLAITLTELGSTNSTPTTGYDAVGR